ncbi:FtsK/SpoIIIE family DNA translocase [Culicoidibacter larvae]|nr:DNA translocase FtsK [Culicoidibacter larvae]
MKKDGMLRMAGKSKRLSKKQKNHLFIEIIGILLIGFTVLCILGEFGWTGVFGDFLIRAIAFAAGFLRFFVYIVLLWLAFHLIKNRELPQMSLKYLGAGLIIFSVLVFCSFDYTTATFNDYLTRFFAELSKTPLPILPLGGGIIGVSVFVALNQIVSSAGTYVIVVALFFIGLILFLRRSVYDFFEHSAKKTQEQLVQVKDRIAESAQNRRDAKAFDIEESEANYDDVEIYDPQSDWPELITENEPVVEEFELLGEHGDSFDLIEPDFDEEEYGIDADHHEYAAAEAIDSATPESTDIEWHDGSELQSEQVNMDLYTLPPIQYLKNVPKAKGNTAHSAARNNAERLHQTFESFGIKARVTNINIGPAVTQYEITLEPGVKVSRIAGLSDDIALALAAKGIRIEAPIPGKSAVGIEVPNESIQMVGLREVLEPSIHDLEQKLLVGLGRDIAGDVIMTALNKAPHLLVAGATGSGKSVCINGIITSILMRTKPSEVKFLMIDPKKVELNVYNDIPHLLAPVVTDPKKAAVALRKIVVEMEERYEKFAREGVRNLEGFNELQVEEGNVPLPYIVVIIDELADLMVVAAKDVEDAIMRLAQMARAAGIHMIVATQRPSVDVITGVIKSNIPSRIAFAVSSQIDSRTILDMGGAEKLVGRGDMLYLPMGESKPIRVQGAYVSEPEIEKVVNFVKKQQAANFDEALTHLEVQESDNNAFDEVDKDFDDVVQFVIETQKASASLLQRRFRFGYNRAARIVDQMEERGIVGPSEGSKPRQVFYTDYDQWLESQNIQS